MKKKYLTLLWGEIKCGDFNDSPEALERFNLLKSITDEQERKKVICNVIDLFNGQVILWWGSEEVDKTKAKEYIRDYGH
jgi:hypothetical protein